MITLNLIAPQQKKEIKNQYLYLSLKRIFILIAIFAVFVTVMIKGAEAVLQQEALKYQQQTNVLKKSQNIYNQQIKDINNSLQALEQIQKNFYPTTNLLLRINELIPEAIYIVSLNYNHPDQTLLMKGKADNRQVLLNFQADIKKIDFIEKVELPLSTILKKEDIDFELKITLTGPTPLPI